MHDDYENPARRLRARERRRRARARRLPDSPKSPSRRAPARVRHAHVLGTLPTGAYYAARHSARRCSHRAIILRLAWGGSRRDRSRLPRHASGHSVPGPCLCTGKEETTVSAVLQRHGVGVDIVTPFHSWAGVSLKPRESVSRQILLVCPVQLVKPRPVQLGKPRPASQAPPS